jgi:pyrroline-5-carboxylate reductase
MQFSEQSPLVIIGGGNMGLALASRWHAHSPIIVEPSALRRGTLQDGGLQTIASLADLKATPQVVVLAIKPQTYPEVSAAVQKLDTLVISIMAGTGLDKLPKRAARVMPNTPAMIGQGMSVCCASNLSDADKRLVNDLFAACGEVVWVAKEETLHAVTAISGSGPAYVFAFMEAFEKAAIDLGIDAETAHILVKQTVFGAASMTNMPFIDFSTLREQVTSKGGTTEAALALLMPHLPTVMREATKAAEERSKLLAGK